MRFSQITLQPRRLRLELWGEERVDIEDVYVTSVVIGVRCKLCEIFDFLQRWRSFELRRSFSRIAIAVYHRIVWDTVCEIARLLHQDYDREGSFS
jgi:hypothetical protein